MKYELIIKEKIACSLPFQTRYKVIVDEKDYSRVRRRYENFIDFEMKIRSHENLYYDAILLVNLLDDEFEFIKTIQ